LADYVPALAKRGAMPVIYVMRSIMRPLRDVTGEWSHTNGRRSAARRGSAPGIRVRRQGYVVSIVSGTFIVGGMVRSEPGRRCGM
jgi:hypothetical protein